MRIETHNSIEAEAVFGWQRRGEITVHTMSRMKGNNAGWVFEASVNFNKSPQDRFRGVEEANHLSTRLAKENTPRLKPARPPSYVA